MKLTDNNALNVLIVINAFALLAIFALLWMLWTNGVPAPVEQEATVANNISSTTSNGTGKNWKGNINKIEVEKTAPRKLTISEKINIEVGAADKTLKNKVGNKVALSKDLTEVKNLDELSDIEYVMQYQKTKNDIQSKRNISKADVTTVKIMESSEKTKVRNKFNSVDVSGLKNRAEMFNSITTRISSLILEEKAENVSKPAKPKAWNDYLSAIKSAGLERKNEMRVIRIKAGESLWEIAVRAYGNGFLYTKIFEANPQLKNPNLITEGEMLRVPL